MTDAAAETWTTRKLQAWMSEAFAKAEVDAPRLMAEMLLEHVLECDRLKLYTDPDRPASPAELTHLRELAKRALKHEPVQYLVGEAWFYGMRFKCDARALVPRACTEVIVRRVVEEEKKRHEGTKARRNEGEERAIERVSESANEGRDGPLIADVCAGSGCVGIALARSLKGARVVATDISGEALALAAENAERFGVDVELREGDLLAPLADLAGEVDYLVSNPPYIPDEEWAAVPPNVKEFEPELALRGGPDGMNLVRPLLELGPGLLKAGGRILVEIASSRAEQAREILAGVEGVARVVIHKDQDGLLRVVEGVRE